MLEIEVELQGVNRLQRKLRPDKLIGPAQRMMLEKISLNIERMARIYSPVEFGTLRASWAHRLDISRVPTWAKVGTNVRYATHLEYSGKSPRGTGRIPFFRPAIVAADIDGPIAAAAKMIEREWGR